MNRRIVTLDTAGLLTLAASAVSALAAAAPPIICDQVGITTVSSDRYTVNSTAVGLLANPSGLSAASTTTRVSP